MSLAVTNVGVEQDPAPFSDSTSHTRPNTFTNELKRAEMTTIVSSAADGTSYYTEFLSVTLLPGSEGYTWSPVNLPQGWYRFESNISTSTFRSGAFYVAEGKDTSCVLPAPAPSGSSSETPSPTDTSSETSTPSGTDVPSDGGSSSSSTHAGAIAGGVVGGVLGLALIAGIFLLCRRRRRSPGQSTGRPRFLGAWGNLGSFESKTRSPAYPSTGGGAMRPETQHHHARDDSMGGPIMLSQASSPAATRLGHGDGSDEEGGFSAYQEKDHRTRSPSFDSRSPFTDVPIAIYNGGTSAGSRPTRHSSLSSTYNFSRRSTSQTFPESVHNSIASSYPSGVPYAPPLINNPSSTSFAASSPTSPHQQTTSAAAAAPPRKTTRKPVPSYVPDEYVYNTSSDTAVQDDTDDSSPIRRAIKHQDSFSSFQNKPMHVLMPDMPPSQRD